MSKINIVAFQEGETSKTVHNGLWQWDYGQTLRIQGLSLPSAVEIHFSLQENGGEAKRRIGITESGVTDVVIPDFILEGNNPASGHYNAFAFIYPSDEESGETTHKIILRIKTRPRPEGDVSTDNEHDPDETTFGAIMAAVREIAERTGGEPTEEQIAAAVEKYMTENPVEGNVTVDSELSTESENPLQNKVVTAKFNQLSEQKVDKMTDEETIEMLIEADLLPAVTTTSGAILTDNNGNVVLRY